MGLTVEDFNSLVPTQSACNVVYDALAPVRVKSRLESIRPLPVKTAGRKNVFGQTVKVRQMQSELGSAGVPR